ncbi:MAG TPA: STAS domain-containing protein [Lentzea sp.]
MTSENADGTSRMSADTADYDGVVVVVLTGEIDMTNAAQMRIAVEAELDRRPVGIVVHLAVEFLASAGLSVLVESNQRAQRAGIGFAVVATASAARRPLTAVGLDQVLPVHDAVADAVEALREASVTTQSDHTI